MGWTRGYLTYNYQIEIGLEDLVDRIAKKIGHMDDGYCWEVDGDKLIISAKHTTDYRHWYCCATLESPAEDELEVYHCVDEVDLEGAVLEALHETTIIDAEAVIDEDYKFEDDWI